MLEPHIEEQRAQETLEGELPSSVQNPYRIPRLAVRTDDVERNPHGVKRVPIESERKIGELSAHNVSVVQIDVRKAARDLERTQSTRAVT